MKLLLILSLVGLAVGQAIVSKPVEANDLHSEQSIYQEAREGDEIMNDRRLEKRSDGWNPWLWPSYGSHHGISLGISHGHGWPSHGWSLGHGLSGWSGHGLQSGWSGHGLHSGWSGHGLHSGWSGHGLHSGWIIRWPLWYGGHGSDGIHNGWHSKW